MYLEYTEYIAMGGTIPESEYAIYEKLAEAEINGIVRGALRVDDTVKLCMKIMLDAFQKADDNSLSGRAQSMSNDGVSVSYRADNSAECALKIARDRIRLLLANAGLSTRSMVVKYRA